MTESEQFDEWIKDTCCNPDYSEAQRDAALTAWSKAPFARFCHPRAEHLLPLHVCFGAATGGGGPAQQLHWDEFMGKRISGYRWG